MYPGNSIITALQNFFHYNEESKEIKTQHTKSKKKNAYFSQTYKMCSYFQPKHLLQSTKTQAVILTNDIGFYFSWWRCFGDTFTLLHHLKTRLTEFHSCHLLVYHLSLSSLLKKGVFNENVHMFCSVKFRINVLFNPLCVMILFQNAGSPLCFHIFLLFFLFSLLRVKKLTLQITTAQP